MSDKKIKALALDWERRSRDDDETARRPLASDLKGAWELLRLLSDAEKANPSEEGLTRPLADGESA